MPLIPIDEKKGVDAPKPRGLQPLEQPPDLTGRNLDAIGNAGIARGLDNLAGVPDMLARLAVDSPTTGIGLLRHGLHGARRALNPGGDKLPASPPRLIEGTPIRDMLPTGRQAVSKVNSLLHGTEMETELDTFDQTAKQNPLATAFGNLSGDAATLFGLRAPMKAGRAGGVLDRPIEEILARGSQKVGARAGKTGVAKQVQEVLDDDRFQLLMRGAGRTVETGAEAAFLEMLQGNDPAESAGIAMAGQALSSGSLTIGKGVVELPFRLLGSNQMGSFGKATIGLAVQGAIMTSILQFMQQNPDEAAETAYDRLTAGALLAMTVGLPGKRPKDDGLLHNFPLIADAILTAPRTAMINAAQYMAEDPEVADVVSAAVETPEAFGQNRVNQISDWLAKGKPEKIRELLDTTPSLQEIMALPPVLRGVPTKREPDRRRNRGPGFD